MERAPLASYYPVGMSECDSNCIFGLCGDSCDIYARGECVIDIEEKIAENCKDMSATKHLEVD